MNNNTRTQLIKFLLTGGTSALIQYLLLITLVEFLHVSETPSSALAFTLSAIFNYCVNYYFTFEAKNSHKKTLVKFSITASLGLSLNTCIFWLGVSIFPHYILAQCLATGVTLLSNFALHKYWIYPESLDKTN